MGPEHAVGKDRTEVACTSDGQGLITSGGGFSDTFARPDYQQTAVRGFLDASKAAGTLPPDGTFNATGRGYVEAKSGGESSGGGESGAGENGRERVAGETAGERQTDR
jgi:hypothetical protein